MTETTNNQIKILVDVHSMMRDKGAVDTEAIKAKICRYKNLFRPEWKLGHNPLICAVQTGRPECINLLIYCGISVNSVEVSADRQIIRTPLIEALKAKDVSAVTQLMKQGAKLDVCGTESGAENLKYPHQIAKESGEPEMIYLIERLAREKQLPYRNF